MESLRWILLGAGLVFVLAIYIIGRSHRQRQHIINDEAEDDLPEFSAQNLDDLDEGVGEVRIISGSDADYNYDAEDIKVDDDITALKSSAKENNNNQPLGNSFTDNKAANNKDEVTTKKRPSDIIVVYILPKVDQLLMGSQINSSAQAMGLSFGDMNIFHYKSGDRKVFSLANMLEPGSFDPDTIHDIKTTGLTIFMQISGDDPLDDLTEMLQRSYQLAGLLDARLCNHKREPLTEQDAENYRTQVNDFITQ